MHAPMCVFQELPRNLHLCIAVYEETAQLRIFGVFKFVTKLKETNEGKF